MSEDGRGERIRKGIAGDQPGDLAGIDAEGATERVQHRREHELARADEEHRHGKHGQQRAVVARKSNRFGMGHAFPRVNTCGKGRSVEGSMSPGRRRVTGRWRGTAECALQGPQGPESIRPAARIRCAMIVLAAGFSPRRLRAAWASLARIAGVRRRCPMRARGGRVAVRPAALARQRLVRCLQQPVQGVAIVRKDRDADGSAQVHEHAGVGAASAAFRFLATCSAASWPPASSTPRIRRRQSATARPSCAARRSCARPRSSAPGRRCRGHRCRSRS